MTYVPQDGRGENYIGPDGRVYWRGIERNTMWDKASESDKTNLRQAAIDRAHVEYDHTGDQIPVPPEVLVALISRAGKWDDHEQYHAERVDFLPEDTTREGVAENGDPFYQRAKKALEEVGIFERVEVRHDTDILTTSDDYGNTMSAYRSGLDHVVIEIEGYTR